MKEKLIYCKSEKRFYSIPQYSSEEVAEMERIGEDQCKRGQYGLRLDSPKAIQDFKSEIRSKYGIHC